MGVGFSETTGCQPVPTDIEDLDEDVIKKHTFQAFGAKAARAMQTLETDADEDENPMVCGKCTTQDTSEPTSRTRAIKLGTFKTAATGMGLAFTGLAAAGRPRRLQCKYGNSCYRKDSKHRQAFAHPGDPDFKLERRPCRYGAGCYQRNPEHRAKFSHPGDPDYKADDASTLKVEAPKTPARWDPSVSFDVDLVGELSMLRSQGQGFVEKYELGKRLNAGAQGVTYLATQKATGRTVVVKKPNDVKDTSDWDEIVEKTHPNIVRVFELFHNPFDTYVVMECCSGGDLFAAVQGLGAITQNWCAGVCKQAFRGTKYLHEQFNTSHNDIKPENILLDHKPTSAADVPRVMIADFGCAASSGTAFHAHGAGGDPRYRAPETWIGLPFTFGADVWALGVTVFELVTGGRLIYVNQPNVSGWANFMAVDGGALCRAFLGAATAQQPVDLSIVYGSRVKDLLTGLLQPNPSSRISMDSAMQHPWFGLDTSTALVQLGEDEAKLLKKRAQSSKLRVALLNLVGSQLQGEAIRYYKDIWLNYDVNGSGTMEFAEFEDMYRDTFAGLGPGLLSRGKIPSARELFAVGDVSGNGLITFDEFIGLMFNADMLDETEKMQYIKSAFKVLAGSDDYITADELASLFPNQDTAVIYQMFREIDQDHNAAIDFDEFSSYIDSL